MQEALLLEQALAPALPSKWNTLWAPKPPRHLTEKQRLELMFPGLLWYAQSDSVGRDHPSMQPLTRPMAKAFMASAVEVTDDLPSDAEARTLVSRATGIVEDILGPIDQIERGVVMIALDMWLQRLLSDAVLELYAGSLFANALERWNTSIMSEPANRRRFPSLLRPAEHHANGIMRRFRELGFYVMDKPC
jgi:hypothetical protein